MPPYIRHRLGKLPNFGDWHVGDLILCTPLRPSLVSRTIIAAQTAGGFDAGHAQWTHVAIYIGAHHVLEAVFPRVRYRPIYKRLLNHCIRLRRPHAADDPAEAHFGYRLAVSALTKLHQYYSLGDVLRMGALCRRGLWRAPPANGEQLPGLFCSHLYAQAYSQLTGRFLTRPDDFAPVALALPAHLSQSDLLRDIPLHWETIG